MTSHKFTVITIRCRRREYVIFISDKVIGPNIYTDLPKHAYIKNEELTPHECTLLYDLVKEYNHKAGIKTISKVIKTEGEYVSFISINK